MEVHEEIPRRDLFEFIRSVMRMAAMTPLNLEDYFQRRWRFIGLFLELVFELFLYLTALHVVVLYACTLYLFYGDGDLVFSVNCLVQLIIYAWTVFMKVYFRRISPALLKDLMESINKEYRTRSAPGLTYVSMEDAHMLSNKWIKKFVLNCFVGAIIWLIIPIAYNDRSLPLPCWYPFDYKQPFVYEIVYILQVVGQLQVASAFSASSGFFMVLAVLLSGQYDVLCCSLKNIVATTYLNMGTGNTNNLRELEVHQQTLNSEPNEYYCAKERKDNYESSAQSQLALISKKLNFSQASNISFKNCVLHHRSILRLLNKMEDFYNIIWMIKCGEVILLMCLVAFVAVKSTTEDTAVMKIVSLTQYLLLVIFELLIICYFGEMIYQNSQRCGEALLRSPWHLHIREMRQDVLIFLMNSQRVFKLSAGKVYSLNITLFREVLKTAFSFFTILQNIDKFSKGHAMEQEI